MTSRLLKVLLLASLPLIMSGCMFYHEPTFHGTILDVDTKQPIEGAVVVVEYKKETMNIFGGGSGNSIINVSETLTNKDGRFSIPSYSTVVDPLSWQTKTVFLIFKPGYVNVEDYLSDYFSGNDRALPDFPLGNENLKRKFPGKGVVELSRVETREDRLKVHNDVRIPYIGVPGEEIKILLRVYNSEGEFLGFSPISIP